MAFARYANRTVFIIDSGLNPLSAVQLQEHCATLLKRLNALNTEHLSRNDVINVMVLRHDLETFVRGYDTILYDANVLSCYDILF